MLTAIDRIKAAIPAAIVSEEQLVKVTAGDVVAVADDLPEERRTETTRALRKGAAAAKSHEKVLQKAVDLAHLIDCAAAVTA